MTNKPQRGKLRKFLCTGVFIISLFHSTTSSSVFSGDDVQELYIRQRVDHFGGGGHGETYLQRYFFSDRHEQQGQNPVGPLLHFVCVGGEGPALQRNVLVDSNHCTGDMLYSAQKLHQEHGYSVRLYGLEHRYYGASFPFNTSTNDKLRYLSSKQAAADLAHFGDSIRLHPSDVVLLFGGSYPGMLASFAYRHYPLIFQGVISNSAPVQGLLDFGQYENHVGNVLKQYDNCFDIVHDGHAALLKYLQTEGGTKYIADLFHICNTTSLSIERNWESWLGDGVVSIGTQENDPSCTDDLCNIPKKCAFLSDHYRQALIETSSDHAQSSMAVLAKLSGIQNENACVDLDWDGQVRYIANPSNNWIRSWLWQTCTEFGFYQTCQSDACPFAPVHFVDMDLELCQRAFDVDNVAENIRETNRWSGGWTTTKDQREHIYSVIGSTDPWSELTVLDAYVVEGASHHFWTHPPRDSDDVNVQRARERIYAKVLEWTSDKQHKARERVYNSTVAQ